MSLRRSALAGALAMGVAMAAVGFTPIPGPSRRFHGEAPRERADRTEDAVHLDPVVLDPHHPGLPEQVVI
ncbi:hypothetical protein [Nonomuraea sp. KM90]|uniref:hypothetical protein n=1 Tax=Nonomuraea sp. KM90 TaxID=3457428 RepID=UPI003FCDB102